MAWEDELKPQPEVLKWTEKTAPMAFQAEDSIDIFQEDSPYRLTMTGKIAVMILIVSGPGKLAISHNEKQTIGKEVQTGLKFWTEQAKNNSVSLEFVVYTDNVTISANNPTECSSSPACHNVFADPTLIAMGYPAGKTGRYQLAQAVKSNASADGAYLALFSKYRQRHFAYAYNRGGPIYMKYSNDGWGPEQIDRVFAHETAHVFNAPDEYTNCKCTQLYGKGSCTATNDNCSSKNKGSCTSSQIGCIMDSNDMGNLCEQSKKHVGWC